MDQNLKGLLLFIITIIVGSFSLTIGIVLLSNLVLKNSINTLGYETRLINLTCYAKYDNRWVLCDVVQRNQFDIVSKK